MNTSTTSSTKGTVALLRFFMTCSLCMVFSTINAQKGAGQGEANHPRSYQIPKYTPSGSYGQSKKQLKKLRTNSELFTDLNVNVSNRPGLQAGFLVTVTFESKLHAHLHVNIINRRNRIKHSEVFSAREGTNLLLLDIESLREGNYRILISKGNQYMRSGFIKI